LAVRPAGRPGAAGRLSVDGANERPIERTDTLRVGITRWRLDSWLRKSLTEEFGRFSARDRRRGGSSTAAHAAATTMSAICPMW
jgi:hypothetical protein